MDMNRVHSRVRTLALRGTRQGPGEMTVGTCAARVRHSEASSVEWKADHHLVGINTSFCDHRERVMRFSLVDLTTEATPLRTSRALPRCQHSRI